MLESVTEEVGIGISTRPESLVENVMDSLHDGIVVIDADGVIVFANAAYTRILNVPVSRILGRNMRDVQPEARSLKVIKTGQPILRDSFYLKDLGLDVVVNSTPIIIGGKVAGAVTVFRTSQELLELYGAYRRAHGLIDYYKRLSGVTGSAARGFDAIIGSSPAIQECIRLAVQVAPTSATVLLTGENGVGKDVFAQAIHLASNRADKPFIAVNSGAIPDTLLESELFGFDGGAFTGAARGGKLGKFELADGGTLFLDEVGDMSPAMQVKLLRALQNQQIEKVGGTRTVKIDTRVIAATNADLPRLIKEGKFREDLFYRLNVFPISIRPLRERRDDIPGLAQHFVHQCCNMYQKQLVISPELFATLQDHDWPGNVRQLRNVIERAVILCDRAVLMPEDVADWLDPPSQAEVIPTAAHALRDEMRRVERRAYEQAIDACEGNRSKAMAHLGVSRRTFYKKLRELGIQG